jgi:hypothetical protein
MAWNTDLPPPSSVLVRVPLNACFVPLHAGDADEKTLVWKCLEEAVTRLIFIGFRKEVGLGRAWDSSVSRDARNRHL